MTMITTTMMPIQNPFGSFCFTSSWVSNINTSVSLPAALLQRIPIQIHWKRFVAPPASLSAVPATDSPLFAGRFALDIAEKTREGHPWGALYQFLLCQSRRHRGVNSCLGRLCGGLLRGTESDPLNELLHFFAAGTLRFSSSNQFSTTLICVGDAAPCSLGLSIKKRWPSGDTS